MKSSILDEFLRVSKARPCLACGKCDWCMISRDNHDSPFRVLCKRVESPRKWGNAGYLHTFGLRFREVGRARTLTVSPSSTTNAAQLAAVCAAASARVTLANPATLASSLSVSVQSLARLGLGWLGVEHLAELGVTRRQGVWSFPMRDQFGAVIGVRLRAKNGFKFAITGSRNGLFIACNLVLPLDRLVVAEGESDTAALLDLGFDALGMPGAGNADDLVVRFIRNTRPRSVVIVGDNDLTGREKATSLTNQLAVHHTDVRTIFPPVGIKDAREWKKAGADFGVVAAAIEASVPVRFSVTSTKKGA